MNYDGYFLHALARLRDERRYRVFADLERIAGRYPHAVWHSPAGPRNVVIWCSNDYLGMGQHPKVIGAMVETANRMGTGAGGTRNITGTNHPLVELERELADLHGKDAALLFTSGYVSNQTGIATIAKLMPGCEIPRTAQRDCAPRDASGGPSRPHYTPRYRPVRRHPIRGAFARDGVDPGQCERCRRDRANRHRIC
jgi:Aminotransferase class I and II